MAGSVPTLYWFDRWDERIGLLRVVGEFVHTEELNGEDTIEFECRDAPTKGRPSAVEGRLDLARTCRCEDGRAA